MDISMLSNIGAAAVSQPLEAGLLGSEKKTGTNDNVFEAFLKSAVNGINETNNYMSAAKDEKIKVALGESENTHDLTIALQKSSTALSYTIAVRDKLLEAYKEIMQIQI